MTWAKLLAQPWGPERVHEQVLRLSLVDDVHLLAPADALAAVVALQGAAVGREFLTGVAPTFAKAARMAAVFRSNDLSMLALLAFAAIGETAGVQLGITFGRKRIIFSEAVLGRFKSNFKTDAKFVDFLTTKIFSKADRAVVGLLALLLGRNADAKLGVQVARKNPAMKLIEVLAAANKKERVVPAWDAFVREFPDAYAAEEVDWRALLLATRLVLGAQGVPVAETADALHRKLLEA